MKESSAVVTYLILNPVFLFSSYAFSGALGLGCRHDDFTYEYLLSFCSIVSIYSLSEESIIYM